ncbi:hypothetical protein [Vibrio hepatarius]|uniref:Uncharacterized protein n=1 Tax=Vibrio hepatarius TaxID=171383 RepID=A0A0M0I5F6_9VIBR|nr:hypothetical protein [Vibrio hepatarius]KOO09163.1 hypothetical protein AKJ31_02035 [Vibrio hepatarius]
MTNQTPRTRVFGLLIQTESDMLRAMQHPAYSRTNHPDHDEYHAEFAQAMAMSTMNVSRDYNGNINIGEAHAAIGSDSWENTAYTDSVYQQNLRIQASSGLQHVKMTTDDIVKAMSDPRYSEKSPQGDDYRAWVATMAMAMETPDSLDGYVSAYEVEEPTLQEQWARLEENLY